jgi:hypothetical protein
MYFAVLYKAHTHSKIWLCKSLLLQCIVSTKKHTENKSLFNSMTMEPVDVRVTLDLYESRPRPKNFSVEGLHTKFN